MISGFLDSPDVTPEIQELFDRDVAENGYVINGSRVWAHSPVLHDAIFGDYSRDLQEALEEDRNGFWR